MKLDCSKKLNTIPDFLCDEHEVCSKQCVTVNFLSKKKELVPCKNLKIKRTNPEDWM
jgi:hypothetical protein